MLSLLTRGPTFAALLCYLCFINVFCPYNDKKVTTWLLRVAGAAVAAAAAMTVIYFVSDPSNASTVLEPPICLLVAWLYAMAVLKMSSGRAFYATVISAILGESCGMLVQRFASLIRITPPVAERALYVGIYLVAALALATLIWKWVRRAVFHEGDYIMTRRKLLFTGLTLVMFLVLSNYQLIFWLTGSSGGAAINIIMAFRVLVGFLAALILFLQNDIEVRQKTRQEMQILEQMWHRQQEQYKLSKENIDIINRKCHDLKHQMAALRQLQDKEAIDRQVAEMENAVMIYDSVVQTGNRVLDVVLTEKSLYCDAHRINMTCLVDGKLLDFIDTVDLYTLFGNALDNAIESVMQQSDKQKRVIQVAVYEEGNMLLIRIRNYCDKVPQLVDGLPVTSKKDTEHHGFGLKSIRHTAEKYGGGISISTGSNFFSLQILIPRQQGQ